jgi:hypothetical protein
MFLAIILSGIVVSVLATGPKFHGIKHYQGRWIFKDDKNSQFAFLSRKRKAVGPCRKIYGLLKPFEV